MLQSRREYIADAWLRNGRTPVTAGIMAVKRLKPDFELLSKEYVLIQAWKKTSKHIRSHNSFADTLALDHATVNLRQFIRELSDRLKSPHSWENKPLRIVPAPKSQDWRIEDGAWEPKEKTQRVPFRPLAHVDLEDQVVATAIMLCLADRVETCQGDPRGKIDTQKFRRRVISYGNRLFCDKADKKLHHRWGSTKLYRSYFQDYRTFLRRPEEAAKQTPNPEGKDIYVIHTDLDKFYDRVRPDLLLESVNRIQDDNDDPEFFSFLKSVFKWTWAEHCDARIAQAYADQVDISDFEQVALPQGLVASGFFANLVLLSFDDELRHRIGADLFDGVVLVDVCRYVDDLRIVIAADPGQLESADKLKCKVFKWLKEKLKDTAPGLKVSRKKTKIISLSDNSQSLLPQRAKMKYIQSAISGGFDAQGGVEILDAIQGLLHAHKPLFPDSQWEFSPTPDVREVTVARFAAARYRTTFRSIRPLLDVGDKASRKKSIVKLYSRPQHDQEARGFATGLVERWINDPSNVRLLKIGLDIWPSVKLLREALSLLRCHTDSGIFKNDEALPEDPTWVAWYCLSEIFRAGATETGLVRDNESLPSDVCLKTYRTELHEEAKRIADLPKKTILWYLRQQALLFLAVCSPDGVSPAKDAESEIQKYLDMIQFLRGDEINLPDSEFATLAIIARRSFVGQDRAIELTMPGLTLPRTKEIAGRDPSFFLELFDKIEPEIVKDLPDRIRQDLCLISKNSEQNTLAKLVLTPHPCGDLHNELSLLYFTKAFLEELQTEKSFEFGTINPGQIELKLETHSNPRIKEQIVTELAITPGIERANSGSLYEPPSWCEPREQWRMQLGFLLRFVLSGHPEFTHHVRPPHWAERESTYRAVKSHWYQRLYGLYSGQQAFGDYWLPMTDWLERFLLALLRWPGCLSPQGFECVEESIGATLEKVDGRINELKDRYGMASRTLILPLKTKKPAIPHMERPLRACVVQTVIPSSEDFCNTEDLALNDPKIRRKHRNHLSAALAAVNRMLVLRNTHEDGHEPLDWLILPELAVHPDDIRTYLFPFARAHKAIILTGLTYEKIPKGKSLANSALWIIPEWSEAHGLQMTIRRQGKQHLAKNEIRLNNDGNNNIQGFRPCQWLIEYPWSIENNDGNGDSFWLTSAVCYDATDLRLATDIMNQSDIFAIPALNRDVTTFDQMAMALHYHMFQCVIVVNNGEFGGSNAYLPYDKSYTRKVFHTYGQPQSTISFLDITDIGAFLKRARTLGELRAEDNDARTDGQRRSFKFPPAGITIRDTEVSD